MFTRGDAAALSSSFITESLTRTKKSLLSWRALLWPVDASRDIGAAEGSDELRLCERQSGRGESFWAAMCEISVDAQEPGRWTAEKSSSGTNPREPKSLRRLANNPSQLAPEVWPQVSFMQLTYWTV